GESLLITDALNDPRVPKVSTDFLTINTIMAAPLRMQQRTLGVRKFSKCGRPSDVFTYQHLDSEAIVEACGRVLAETALENLRVSQGLLQRLASDGPRQRLDWRELWPDRA
ncbi:MAG: hypothetical protein V3T22_06755, partial [Planctomycetota bacterium]